MKKTIVLLSALFLFLTSCDRGQFNCWAFENTTEDEIYVKLFYDSTRTPKLDSFSISRNNQYIFHEVHAWGTLIAYPSDFGIDSISIESPGLFSKGFNTETEGTNPFDSEHWNREGVKQSGVKIPKVINNFEISAEVVEGWKIN